MGARRSSQGSQAAAETAVEAFRERAEAESGGVEPGRFPPVLPTEAGHVLTAVDNLNPFWTLYAPSHEEDPRGLIGDVCSAFGLPEPAVGSTVIDGQYLASRVQRYLVQHPYVHTLTINAFNAGRATPLADMLLYPIAQSTLTVSSPRLIETEYR